MNGTVDTGITIVLFIALLVPVTIAFGVVPALFMLGDNVTSRRGNWGVILGIAGVPCSALVTYVTAVVLACLADGYTLYYPIAALAVGVALAVGIITVAGHVVRHG